MSFVVGRHSATDMGPNTSLSADVCVIGAGAGGSAATLAMAEAGLDVLVLEAGRHWRPQDFRASTAFALRHLYHRRGVETALGNTVLPIAQGRGVGGSTLVNSAICFRPPAPIIDHWREHAGFDPDHALESRIERVWGGIGATVNPPAVQKENNLIFKKGVEALGLDGAFMPRSAPGCVGCGVCQLGCPTGGKLSVDRSLLAQAEAKGSVAVHAGCRVLEVREQGDRIVSVSGEVLHPETDEPIGVFEVRADQFVLSAGTFGSPRFLLKNGLADGEHCGAHLRLHPGLGAVARFPHVIRPWEGVTQGYYVDRLDRGYLLETYTVTPDQYFLNMPLPIGKEALEVMADLEHMGSSGVMASGWDSEGSVGAISTQFDLADADRERLIHGVRDLAEVFFAAGALEVFVPIVGVPRLKPGMDIASALPLDLPAVDMCVYSSHIMGTCRMGTTADSSVVDPTGRVWGWKNLHVSDASSFPTALSVNPQVTIMANGLLVGEAVARG